MAWGCPCRCPSRRSSGHLPCRSSRRHRTTSPSPRRPSTSAPARGPFPAAPSPLVLQLQELSPRRAHFSAPLSMRATALRLVVRRGLRPGPRPRRAIPTSPAPLVQLFLCHSPCSQHHSHPHPPLSHHRCGPRLRPSACSASARCGCGAAMAARGGDCGLSTAPSVTEGRSGGSGGARLPDLLRRRLAAADACSQRNSAAFSARGCSRRPPTAAVTRASAACCATKSRTSAAFAAMA